jgi:hypothetical protein
MKGGLTRSSVVEDKFQISNQFGGISRTLGLSLMRVKNQERESRNTISKLKTNQISISTALTSRNAENLFWVEDCPKGRWH